MNQLVTLPILYYLRFFAKLQLKKNNPDIIGITGSAGKTSCRDAVNAILKDKFRVKVSHKANSESGIPLNILGLTPTDYSPTDWLRLVLLTPIKLLTNFETYDKYIVEMGIDSPYAPKNMQYLLTIIKPQIGIFLNAYPVHTESFDPLIKASDPHKRDQEAKRLIAAEKGRLITSLPSSGLAILNVDDKNVHQFAKKTNASVITFGSSEKSALRIKDFQVTLNGSHVTFENNHHQATLVLDNYVLNSHFAYTLAAAVCVGLNYNIPLDESIALLKKNFSLPKSRSSIIKATNGATIIDSSYNASTIPTLDALDTLDSIAPKRKLTLLGDMRELGREAKLAHQEIAKKAASICDHIYLVGPLMKQYALPKIDSSKVTWYKNAKDAANDLKTLLKENDTLLVKGSQNTIFLEYAVEKLMQNPQDADKLLCRRGTFWDIKRQESGLE